MSKGHFFKTAPKILKKYVTSKHQKRLGHHLFTLCKLYFLTKKKICENVTKINVPFW